MWLMCVAIHGEGCPATSLENIVQDVKKAYKKYEKIADKIDKAID